MTTPETGTPTTASECSHDLKKYAKKHTGINYIIQSKNAWLSGLEEEYVTDEQLQGLWEWYQKTEQAGSTLRDMSRKAP